MKILHVDSSILSDGSVSRQLTAEILSSVKAAHPAADVVRLDVAEAAFTHLTGVHLGAAQGAPAPDHLKEDIAAGQKALSDFVDSDIVIIGAPMYNFSIPSQLKAWMDRLAAPNVTFKYTERGPEGLAGGKKLIIASSRGGIFSEGSPQESLDHQETYIRTFFGFLGVTDITFIRAEGVAMGPEMRKSAIDAAVAHAQALSQAA